MEFLGEMKAQVLSHYDLLTVGEAPLVDTAQAIALTDEQHGYLSMLFQFQHMNLGALHIDAAGQPSLPPWGLADLRRVLTRWQVDLAEHGWNSNYLSNHDHPRQVSRFGNDGAYRVPSAKLLATLNHLLRGTPYVYQGEEIGMTNVAFPTIADYRDIAARNLYHEFVDQKGFDPGLALAMLHAKSRDNARTPMPWTGGPQAGFTTGTPWIGLNPNYTAINVAQAQADPDSVWHYYQRLIRLRRSEPVIIHGRYDLLLPEHSQIYAFTRTWETDRLLVILNMSDEASTFNLPVGVPVNRAELLLSNYAAADGEDLRRLGLRPWEARVYRVG
jgi:oligo-1,6-glucosidase